MKEVVEDNKAVVVDKLAVGEFAGLAEIDVVHDKLVAVELDNVVVGVVDKPALGQNDKRAVVVEEHILNNLVVAAADGNLEFHLFPDDFLSLLYQESRMLQLKLKIKMFSLIF